jgi:hypothetical protein
MRAQLLSLQNFRLSLPVYIKIKNGSNLLISLNGTILILNKF